MARQEKRVRLAAFAAALLASSAAAAWASPTEATPQSTTPSRAVGGTHHCSDYYPDLSRRLNESGDVLVRYDVEADGTLSNIKVEHSSGFERLDRAALQCVTQRWRNTPARLGGIAVGSPYHQAIIRFTLHETPVLPVAPGMQGAPNLPGLPGYPAAPIANTPVADAGDTDAVEALIWTLGPLAILAWLVRGTRLFVFKRRDCPACHARNRSILPFTQPGYCSSCGIKFAPVAPGH